MNTWGSALYGDPCRECGFTWTMGLDDACVLIAEVPTSFEQILMGATGAERHPDVGWSVGAYVCHVADNLHICAERLAGSTAGPGATVGAYDQDLLAVA